MKLRDFLTLKSGSGILLSGNVYNPYINYSWSQTLTVGSNQQIKDTGTAGLNLQQLFGQGCWFNGIDMQITIPVNVTIQTEIKRVNGVVEINTNTQNLTNYNVYSGSGAKVYKDLYMFNRALTPTEIEKYTNQPNQFFMDSLEDSSCILAMPMCEKDGFVRNYKSYSEGNNLVVDSNFQNQNLWVRGDSNTTNISGSALNFNNTASFVYPTPFLSIFNTAGAVDTYFMVELEVFNYQSGSVRVEIGASVSNNNATPFLTSNGKYRFFVKHTTNSTNRPVVRVNSFTGSVTNLKIKELTSIYPITNYLSTCRTIAQRLTYGLQTSGFKRDSNGLILSKSNFLEADGVGYGNTGWIIDTANDFYIECVFNRDTNSFNTVFGVGLGLASDIRFRVDSSNFSFSFGNPTKYINSPSSIGSHLVTINYKADTKTYSMFINGVLIGIQSGSEITNSIFSIGLLANTRGTIVPSVTGTSARLFKVHQKALTQEEVTKNFNKYKSQGLLNE